MGMMDFRASNLPPTFFLAEWRLVVFLAAIAFKTTLGMLALDSPDNRGGQKFLAPS